MRLPKVVEYALRSMAHLATKPMGSALSASNLSKETGIPNAFLSKVMRRLVLAKLVESRKGHGGGFSLTRAPSEIRFREILTAVDYDLDPERCAFGWDDCDAGAPCPLHPAWSLMKDSFADWANHTTLAEVDPTLEKSRRAKKGPKPDDSESLGGVSQV